MRYVYFLRSQGRIKIGVAEDVERRAAQIGSYLPDASSLLGHIRGGFQLEKKIHVHLANYRLNGEWFEECEEVTNVCNELMHGGGPRSYGWPIDDVKPPPDDLPPVTDEQRLIAMNHTFKMMWPENTAEHIAEFTEYPVYEVRKWLLGERMPRLVKHALSDLMLAWMLGGKSEFFDT